MTFIVKKALFEADKLSIHIYALAPAPVRVSRVDLSELVE